MKAWVDLLIVAPDFVAVMAFLAGVAIYAGAEVVRTVAGWLRGIAGAWLGRRAMRKAWPRRIRPGVWP